MRREEEEPGATKHASFVQLVNTLPMSIGFGLLLALVALIFLLHSRSLALLLFWVSAQAAVSAWRLYVIAGFRRATAAREPLARHVLLVRAGCLLSGLVWGSIFLLPISGNEPQDVLFIAFLLAGVTSGGMTAMASDLLSCYMFQYTVLPQAAIRLLFVEAGSGFLAMGLTTLIYMLFLTAWTRRLNHTIRATLHAQLDAQRREEQLLRREVQYRQLAHHDALTGLPNRLAMQPEVARLLEEAARTGVCVAIVFIDLDHFKDINDACGHRCGDHVLAATGQRLRDCVRPNDLVARLGGDEFVVVALVAQSGEHLNALAQRLARSIQAPLQYETETIHTSASLGIAVYPDDGSDGDTLLRNADIALYAAKAEGRRTHRLFTPAMSAAFGERMYMEQSLRRALGTEQLYLEYQPLVELGSGSLTGFEALLRWQHPDRGLVPPLVFIPIAERCGLIDALGNEVALQVCRQLALWRGAGLPLVPVAINISPRHFELGELAPQLSAAAQAAGVEPSLLQLEITESALMNGTGREVETLQALKQLGIKVMIDDFGIGFSSLNHLRSLAIDGLKIDRSFVSEMTSVERDASIVSAVVGIARSLGIAVLAEGVESAQHVQQLRRLGCDLGQGNFLHVPVNPTACAELLAGFGRGEPVARMAPRLQLVT
jgi:diguanylate cyclase (GGDEF)-like protein